MQKGTNTTTKYFDTYADIGNLINDPRIPCTVYWDKKVADFVCMEDQETVADYLIKVPTLDELVPYNEAVNGFCISRDIIPNKNPIRFIWNAGLTHEFQEYRLQEAIKRLIKWGKSFGIDIALSKENPIPEFQPNSSYTFKSFVVTGHCKAAYSLALEIAENEYLTGLYGIQGEWGMGRSHLLHAAIQRSDESFPLRTTHLVNENSFLWEYKYALEVQKEEILLQFYRSVDLLCFDNLDQIFKEGELRNIVIPLISARLEEKKLTVFSTEETLHNQFPPEFLNGGYRTVQILSPSLEEKRVIGAHIVMSVSGSCDIKEKLDTWCLESDNFRELSGYIYKHIVQQKLQPSNPFIIAPTPLKVRPAADSWDEVKRYLRNQFSAIIYNTWFKKMELDHVAENVCYISIPLRQSHVFDFLNNKYRTCLEEVIGKICNQPYTVQFISRK